MRIQSDNSSHYFVYIFIKYIFISFTLSYLAMYYTHKIQIELKSALELLISYCVLISRTKKCLSQRCKIFRKFCPEPQISRRHAGDMQQAASCGPTNISATLRNSVAHELCTPELIYNITSAPVYICRLSPACTILSAKFGSV